jgi:acyl carrier protein
MNAMPETTLPSVDDVRARVRAVLRTQFGAAADALADDSEFVTLAAGFDSLTALDMIARVESEFGIEVDFVGHDVRHWFASPGRITRYVTDQLEDRAALGSTQ